jgi:hypothetical protein
VTGVAPITLELASLKLGWPAPADIIHPQGAGPAVFGGLVRNKIGRSLQCYVGSDGVRLGVLMADHAASTSEPPLAIVAEFVRPANEEGVRELHRLAWNFSHAPALITVEPDKIRAWSCCEEPDPERALEAFMVAQVTRGDLSADDVDGLEARAARALHWINLVSGCFFEKHSARFNRDGRADQMLLNNLRSIRCKLSDQGLRDDDICHDLLARVIFVQFLFDRKDHDGNPALTVATLHRLQRDGVLRQRHDSFESILRDYDDAYKLFDWLNIKFNGDLFPGKGDTAIERALGWEREQSVVRPAHLALLSEFIRGDLDMTSRQLCLWPQYAFDVIPLEFISSIYEAFVTERAARDGIFYTPPYLVDFVLDRVLPWHGDDWDIKVLDPACGSGIFLVKAFQRLVHRWKRANESETVCADLLRRLLERNLFGVDKDPHAVRVACFSLYLAMCDEIEPRHYWTQVTFPSMRQRRLVCSDFFSEGERGFDSSVDANSYDLVIGNAPWGDGVITQDAVSWAEDEKHPWTIPNNDIGGLFLAKASLLVADAGRVALIQSANSILFNISPKAVRFRKEFFSRIQVDEIYNLSALRFRVFKRKTHTTKTSAAPACVVIMRGGTPDFGDIIHYVSPKRIRTLVDEFTIVIEGQDRQRLSVRDAIYDHLIWSKLMWGGPRDIQLIKKLQGFPTLGSLVGSVGGAYQQGITFGDGQKLAPHLDGRRMFDDTMFPEDGFIYLRAESLDVVKDLKIHSRASTGLEAFNWPQLIVKHSWNKPTGRFHARITASQESEGVLCNQSYVSIHASEPILESAAIAHNSMIAVYFHFLTSGRFAAYRPKLSKDEILNLPIPEPVSGVLAGVVDYSSLDERAFALFGLKDAERVLVEDALDYTLPDFMGGAEARGSQSTCSRSSGESEAFLRAYCMYFSRVLKSGFGLDKAVCSTIFRTVEEDIPYRLVAFELCKAGNSEICVRDMVSSELLREFSRLGEQVKGAGGLFGQRVARIYDASSGVPTIFLIKPDQKRFWTRSMGLQDADDVAVDLFRWQHESVFLGGEVLN